MVSRNGHAQCYDVFKNKRYAHLGKEKCMCPWYGLPNLIVWGSQQCDMADYDGRTIRVTSLLDSEQTANKKWQVKVSGGRVSTHRKKSAAKRSAKQQARRGDDMYFTTATAA